MDEEAIYNVVNGLKYVCDKNIKESYYDGDNTIHMSVKDWKKFKKELKNDLV